MCIQCRVEFVLYKDYNNHHDHNDAVDNDYYYSLFSATTPTTKNGFKIPVFGCSLLLSVVSAALYMSNSTMAICLTKYDHNCTRLFTLLFCCTLFLSAMFLTNFHSFPTSTIIFLLLGLCFPFFCYQKNKKNRIERNGFVLLSVSSRFR